MLKLKSSFKVIKDKVPAIRHAIANMNNAQAIIGWEGEETYPGTDLTVAQVAVFNEYGTQPSKGRGGIPARPFMRQAYAKNLRMIIASQAEVHARVISGEWTVEKALAALGYRFQEALRSEILRGDFQENSERTLERKRRLGQGGRPLIASRRMLNALRFRLQLHGNPLGDQSSQDDKAAAANQRAGDRQKAFINARSKAKEVKAAKNAQRAKDLAAKTKNAKNLKAIKARHNRRIAKARADARAAFSNRRR